MILPDKNIRLEYSLLNCGARVLAYLNEPRTVSELWMKMKQYKGFTGYEKFLLTLDYLYMINAILYEKGVIKRCDYDKSSAE